MQFKIIKHLALPGALLLLAFSGMAQSGTVTPWQVFKGTVGRSNPLTIGFGLDIDTQYVYTGFNDNEAPFHSYLFRTHRSTGNRDSLLLSNSDSTAFLPFHILAEDSLITCIGITFDFRNPNDQSRHRSAIIRVSKKWRIKDSLVFGESRFRPRHYLSLGNAYYITEHIPGRSGAKLTQLSKYPIREDTCTFLPIGNLGSSNLSIAFMHSIKKLFVVSSVAQGFLIDTANLRVDSNFIPWDTSLPPFSPNIRDLIQWGNDVYGIGHLNDWHLFKYTAPPFSASGYKFFESDTINGIEKSFIDSYDTTDSLLTFSTSGPFFFPNLGNSPTYIRIYAFNKQGQKVWQTKIENGEINRVHSHAMDKDGIFIYVRNFSAGDPFVVPQKMLIYKLDNNGNVLQLANNKVVRVGLHLYPNPSTGTIHYDVTGYMGRLQDVKFTLYDMQGREQFTSRLHQETGSFELLDLPTGSYTYKFQIGQESLRSGILILEP